jgi:hypothetical protein
MLDAILYIALAASLLYSAATQPAATPTVTDPPPCSFGQLCNK